MFYAVPVSSLSLRYIGVHKTWECAHDRDLSCRMWCRHWEGWEWFSGDRISISTECLCIKEAEGGYVDSFSCPQIFRKPFLGYYGKAVGMPCLQWKWQYLQSNEGCTIFILAFSRSPQSCSFKPLRDKALKAQGMLSLCYSLENNKYCWVDAVCLCYILGVFFGFFYPTRRTVVRSFCFHPCLALCGCVCFVLFF